MITIMQKYTEINVKKYIRNRIYVELFLKLERLANKLYLAPDLVKVSANPENSTRNRRNVNLQLVVDCGDAKKLFQFRQNITSGVYTDCCVVSYLAGLHRIFRRVSVDLNLNDSLLNQYLSTQHIGASTLQTKRVPHYALKFNRSFKVLISEKFKDCIKKLQGIIFQISTVKKRAQDNLYSVYFSKL